MHFTVDKCLLIGYRLHLKSIQLLPIVLFQKMISFVYLPRLLSQNNTINLKCSSGTTKEVLNTSMGTTGTIMGTIWVQRQNTLANTVGLKQASVVYTGIM